MSVFQTEGRDFKILISLQSEYFYSLLICENAQQFGAHVTNCKCNPKRQDILNKIIITKKKKYKIFKLCCLFCKTEYELELTD